MLVTRIACGLALAAATLTLPAAASAAAPTTCNNVGWASGADTANTLTPRLIKALKARGVTTIARYYDYPDETIRGKTLTAAERDLAAAQGIKLVVVFQHHNDQLASFTPERGTGDAARSLELAAALGQPAGSAIYFGVDGGWSSDADQAKVVSYFQAVKAKLAGSGYKIGVYGSGLTCKTIGRKGLANYCWLAGVKSWPGYQNAINTGGWSIRQGAQQLCGGLYVDFDRINPYHPDVGQFTPAP